MIAIIIEIKIFLKHGA